MALLLLVLSGAFVACGHANADEVIDPDSQSPSPSAVSGKWLYGTFSLGSFWGTDGSYKGAGYEQAMALNFNANGTYEMYVMNVTTSYSCRTGDYSYYQGKAKFNEADQSIRLTPTEGTFRGEYSCIPGKNFKRAATSSELARMQKTYYYQSETDAKGAPVLRLYFSATDKQGAQFKPGHW